jgi:hypothetical protein
MNGESMSNGIRSWSSVLDITSTNSSEKSTKNCSLRPIWAFYDLSGAAKTSEILTKTNHSISVSVEQLKCRFIEGVGKTEQPFESFEFGERDEPIFAGIDDPREQLYRMSIVILLIEQSEKLDDEILRGHKLLPVLFFGRIFIEDFYEMVRISSFQISTTLKQRRSYKACP